MLGHIISFVLSCGANVMDEPVLFSYQAFDTLGWSKLVLRGWVVHSEYLFPREIRSRKHQVCSRALRSPVYWKPGYRKGYYSYLKIGDDAKGLQCIPMPILKHTYFWGGSFKIDFNLDLNSDISIDYSTNKSLWCTLCRLDGLIRNIDWVLDKVWVKIEGTKMSE